jgi:hypothetical protein
MRYLSALDYVWEGYGIDVSTHYLIFLSLMT